MLWALVHSVGQEPDPPNFAFGLAKASPSSCPSIGRGFIPADEFFIGAV